MKILGIDPGFGRVGIAVIEKGNKETLLYSECFETNSKTPFVERLKLVGEKIDSIISEYSPDTLAIETLFFNNNQKTAMQVSEARGVILYEASKNGLVVYEYTPLQIKDAVVGYGRGTKDQVAHMVHQLIEINKEKIIDDEYDAIAVALTCSACIRE
ncbi:crossover junction endodeoxyribonuclease RuvC [Candidatus Wolfebacteria bacterium]|nr:MAG: crossover junction endodeoxyribonuclease RuvC [Candidatus Wolfebacteria bacterium]